MVTRVFFTTDLHGSEKCFLKFVNAGKFYKVNTLIMGGDITGKMMIPIVKEPGGKLHATFLGNKWTAKNEVELQDIQRAIRFAGYYPYLTDLDEMKRFEADQTEVQSVIKQLMLDNVKRWIQLAEERLRDSGMKVYITGGNDDIPEIEEIISGSNYVIDPEGKVVDVDGVYEMISTGWSNPTPWKTPRECSEEELWTKIEHMVSHVKNLGNSIFNIHVPPINSGIDTCPELDENLKPVIAGGEIQTKGGGSRSVRKAIETYQPLLGLHGHIHESKGFLKIGRTLCLNPGSEYSEGILRGVVVELDRGSVKNYLLTQG
ncbi:MAG: metallophosphoesterase [Candidatus Bathyarchaeia archaeon]|jgi:Icc-related predicted phosphoesterase